MGVAAELGEDAGVGNEREIVRHDRDGTAKEAEGRGGHALVLEGDEFGQAALDRFGEQLFGQALAQGGVPLREGVARTGGALPCPDGAKLVGGLGMGVALVWVLLLHGELQCTQAFSRRRPEDQGLVGSMTFSLGKCSR